MDTPSKNYYPYFDYLRVVLASIVMFGHDGLISWDHSGKLAVDIFFALSGWLIGGILIKTEVKKLPRFYFNRAIRIWVPYYIALILIVVASLLKDPIDHKWLEFILYKITWVYNFFGPPQLQACKECMPLDGTGHHFWSVNAEEQFYLLAPLLLVVFARAGRQLMTWCIIVSVLWFLGAYTPIAFGVLAAIGNNKFPEFYSENKVKFILLLLLIVSGIGLYASSYKLYSPLFAISVVLLLAIKGKRHAVGGFLGGISYPLYLNHWIGVFLFNWVLEPFDLRESDLRHFLSAVFNYGLAAFLFWQIESRVLGMRNELYTVKRGLLFSAIAYFLIVSGFVLGLILFPSINVALVLTLFLITTYIVLAKMLVAK